MSTRERRRFEQGEQRKRIELRDRWTCQNPECGRPAREGRPQLAHLIAKTQWAYRNYGSDVIDADENMVLVCSGYCNDVVQVTHNPVLCGYVASVCRRAVDDGIDGVRNMLSRRVCDHQTEGR
jgi:hypothetical protein